MIAQFNYRYYLDENQYETINLSFNQIYKKQCAYDIKDIGSVIQFAENEQQSGRYVALYLTYEASKYFNPNLAVHHTEENEILAVAYSFESDSVFENAHNEDQNKIFKAQHSFQFVESDQSMIHKIKAIQHAIVEGNTYQVNYTSRLQSPIVMPIKDVYDLLTQTGNGNYTVLINSDEIQVASISPELFFQKGTFNKKKNIIVSKPMKGTMPRDKDPQVDARNYELLKHSLKDRAENVMIVDLLRNDIARIVQPGSIKVYQPFFIETYETVYQMTSMVTGQLKDQHNQLDEVLKSLFPCGSITGAPKRSTMAYIKELEATPRYIYCGTIGLLLPDERMIFNIPIRTIEYRRNKAIYGVGAGITINSIPEDEVQEFRDKTKILERI